MPDQVNELAIVSPVPFFDPDPLRQLAHGDDDGPVPTIPPSRAGQELRHEPEPQQLGHQGWDRIDGVVNQGQPPDITSFRVMPR